ncbi:MAG: hypothetical protein M1823_005324 [Watsoniomyces obsoletus]|nr:MAG: hypothetical protein M1823_005324 [Watsoniomyces obsoletus]
MPADETYRDEERQPLTREDTLPDEAARKSTASQSSFSTTSIVLEELNGTTINGDGHDNFKKPSPSDGYRLPNDDHDDVPKADIDIDLEDAAFIPPTRPTKKRRRSWLWWLGGAFVFGWILALVIFLLRPAGGGSSPTSRSGGGNKITIGQVLGGHFRPQKHEMTWIEGANGEDGLLLERDGGRDKDYLVVEDVRSKSSKDELKLHDSRTLMKSPWFSVLGRRIYPSEVWPSRDLRSVLIASDKKSNWRHSFRGKYWLFDVATQTGQALDWTQPDSPIQLAAWSPQSDAVAFVRDNNLFLRKMPGTEVIPVTQDGGPELFYGVPDWVYEEEVFSGNSAMWWAEDGQYIAFLRTNETMVPEYPIQYFVSRPSGEQPPKELENYPEVRQIKYPKAGAPNPVVDLQFYDVARNEVFSVDVEGDFPDDDRLITEVIWAGSTGKVLVRETNRESDILRVVLIDVKTRTGKAVRTVDVNALDHGWFEVTHDTRYIPADAPRGRVQDGYIDTIIHEGYDHLGYFSPLDNPNPILLTSGSWEVVTAPSAVDLVNNVVYFVGTKESPIQRHIYSVKLDGSDLSAVTDVSKEGYYEVSFSKGAGYALLSYNGPEVPWQEVISTPSNPIDYVHIVEENKGLNEMISRTAMPEWIYSNVTIDGYILQVVERRPPHFDPRKKYPVLFHLYGGPGSQTVNKKWTVDFQAYVASNLGYIVVTVDGRGTGFIGRKARCIIRGNIGYYESRDQIETAKIWAKKEYVDDERIAIWGWSYGGFLTLKTLETDAGETFKYGMAVAPVTDWKFYGNSSRTYPIIPQLTQKMTNE